MTFVFNEDSESQTIKTFTNDGENFNVTYIDGHTDSYISNPPEDEIKRLNNEMLKAIALRKAHSKVPDWRMARMRLGEILLLMATGASLSDENTLATSIFAVGTACFAYAAVLETKRGIELKKYDLLLELYEHFEEINTPEFMEGIENYIQNNEELSLATADDFSYKDIKRLYRRFNNGK